MNCYRNVLSQTLECLSGAESTKERKIAVPAMKDHEAWHRFCFAAELGITDDGRGQPGDKVDTGLGDTNEDASLSTPQTLGQMEQTTSNTSRAMMKRKRDLAYGLGITLVREDTVDADGEEEAVDSQDSVAEGDTGELAEDEEGQAEVDAAWARAERALQWSGATNVEPTTSVLLQFDQVLTQRLLALQIDWLEGRCGTFAIPPI
jgi:hypothetical protein